MDRFKPSRLWKHLTPARRLEAAHAFWSDTQSAEQQAEATLAVAQHLKFRPRSAAALPDDKKARYLANLPVVSDLLASRLLVAYHLAAQRPMLARFLDLLGITHENGLITQEQVSAPGEAQLADAARALAAEFPREDVDVYFATLVSQDPETWSGLERHVALPV
jgi:hypothetical protein